MNNETSEAERSTLAGGGGEASPATVRRRRAEFRQTFYLDLSDLMEYAKHNGTLSGIQRVVSSILIYAEEWANGQSSYTIVPVVPEYDRYRVLAVDFRRVVAMIKLIEENQGGRAKIDAAISAVYDSRVEMHPRKGDLFVIAGAFWIYAHYDLIMRLRGVGVAFGLFVHDLIQIKKPQFVHKEATLVFRRSLIDALSIADFVLTNSHFVAGEMVEFLAQRLDFDLPVAAVPLATELRVKSSGATGAALGKDIQQILASDYVLCVGTIEVRKNHLLLVKIWEQLAKELGDQLPDLVFVGKWGWDIAALREHIDQTEFLDGRLRVLTSASDAALVELYRHCLMTTYVSFAEGFGLPVGESLAYGKPCVASRATSLPEVGGRFARYIDPNDPEEGVRLFKSLLSDRGEIERWSADIRANYAPKSWRDFTFEFLDACSRLAKPRGGAQAPNNCVLPVGTTYYLGDDAVQRVDDEQRSLSTFRMARDAHWHPIERWGCWASAPDAALQFQTNAPQGATVAIALHMHAPPGSERASVLVSVNGATPKRFALHRASSWCAVSGVVGPEGVRIDLKSEGKFGQPDTRLLYVGLQALEIAGAGDQRALMRRSMKSRGYAAARSAAARTPGRSLFSPQRRADSLRRAARLAVDERLAEGGDRTEVRAQTLQLIGPGDEIRTPMALALPTPGVLDAPPGTYMIAANCLARDFYAPEFKAFCGRIDRAVELHRRIWEYAFVAHHLDARGALEPEKRGLALSEDDDPLPELFAAQGLRIDRVPVRGVGRYDFLWSVGRLLARGPDEAASEMRELVETRLAPGGVAVFTGELNLSLYAQTPDAPLQRAFTRAEFEDLARDFASRGHRVAPLPFELGASAFDAIIDLPPYGSGVHLKVLDAAGCVVTCFGVVIVKGGDGAR